MLPHANDKTGEVDEDTFHKNSEDVPWHLKLMLNRPLKVIITLFLVSVAAPVLIYNYIFTSSIDIPPSDGMSVGSCLLPRESRLLCGKGIMSHTDCHPQCCYDMDNRACFHRFPSRFTYLIDEGTWSENVTLRPRVETIPFDFRKSIEQLKISIDEISSRHLSVTLYNPLEASVEGRVLNEKNYTYHIATPELSIVINDTAGNTVFNSQRGPIIAADNIWEITFKLTDETMYGLGELPLERNMVKVLHNHVDGWSGIPLIYSRVNDTYHGFLVDGVEPTELQFTGDNQIVMRSLTSIGIRFHLFTGPKPEDIMNDVIKYLGFENKLQYWMLGAHICSENTSPDSFKALTDFLAAATTNRLPFDSHCGLGSIVFDDNICSENYYKDDVETGSHSVRSSYKRFVPHVSPYILYQELDINIDENSTMSELVEAAHHYNCSGLVPSYDAYMLQAPDSDDMYFGEIGNKTVIYPHYKIVTDDLMTELWNFTDVDGVVLENNWPLDESLKYHNGTYNFLPYFNENFEKAFNHTLPWNVTSPSGKVQIYNHNLYGNYFASAFKNVSRKDVPIWSSSQWMSADVINRQNVRVSWADLHKQIVEIAIGGVSGHWLWSSPVCGDTDSYHTETQALICLKWYLASTYFPLVKIHSKTVRRDPLSFTGTFKAYTLTSLRKRQSLLPYFYTTLQRGPLLRPMFYQFPFSLNVRDLKSQFSVGNDIVMVPNLHPAQSHVHVVMPPGLWYELWSGLPLNAQEGEIVTMAITEADFLALLRGGAIIATQKDTRETSEKTRQHSDYSITVALDCQEANEKERENSNRTGNKYCYAEGSIYITQNLTITLRSNSKELTIRTVGDDFKPLCDDSEAISAHRLKDINVYGLDEKLNNFDNHRHVEVDIELCILETSEEIIVPFIE